MKYSVITDSTDTLVGLRLAGIGILSAMTRGISRHWPPPFWERTWAQA